ncbi:flagellar protein [Motiliproteus coralliicola]|uniref:Flagellar protein FliL n=1 Tax=Motiliproteus coralliicola TaxID=2283196 RepID=A0A369WK46_9GAMM|nr:flagellar basal body-associated FliL family protein [Motiliproteus coralliicola]RDE22418.1 flagellar protein [Motiliproteus coralliicola]
MADEKAPEEGAEEAPKGGKKKLLIIIIAAVVLLAGGGAAAFFLLGGDEAPAEAQVEEVRKEAIYVKLRTLGGKPSFINTFQEKTGRQRFLQIFAEAMTRDQEVADALNKHMPLVVHQLSTLFASQEFKVLQTTEGKQQLRKESTRALQELMQKEIGRPGVEEVFFTNFVMQ